jgi:hypothetical protein
MIYVARLYQARVLLIRLKPSDPPLPRLNFETYPLLEDIFIAMERHLKALSTAKVGKGDRASLSTQLEDMRKHAKKGLNAANTAREEFLEVHLKLAGIAKKVKALEKRKDKKRAASPPQLSDQQRKLLEEMLKADTKKRKKKG